MQYFVLARNNSHGEPQVPGAGSDDEAWTDREWRNVSDKRYHQIRRNLKRKTIIEQSHPKPQRNYLQQSRLKLGRIGRKIIEITGCQELVSRDTKNCFYLSQKNNQC